jgi:hypothetical protein
MSLGSEPFDGSLNPLPGAHSFAVSMMIGNQRVISIEHDRRGVTDCAQEFAPCLHNRRGRDRREGVVQRAVGHAHLSSPDGGFCMTPV